MAPGLSLQSHAHLDLVLWPTPQKGHQGGLMPKTPASSEAPPLPEILFPILSSSSSVVSLLQQPLVEEVTWWSG